jgi:dihydroorotate dehydrogenase (NAD+) catalytic subunit
MDLSVDIGGITLKNPITIASGTGGYGEELAQFIDLSRLGALFTKGLSLEPRPGNRGHRIIETPSGVLNSIGLENVGVKRFLEEKIPFLRERNVRVIPNVAGHSVDENVELCGILSGIDGIDALELNVSCPNVKEGGIAFGTNAQLLAELIERAREVTGVVLIVKLSPNVADIAGFARIAKDAGADAVSAVNTYLGMKIDIERGKPYFDGVVAGLSGPAIRPLAVRSVFEIYKEVDIPIIGMGGISSIEDVIEFIMAGASAVSIGTMTMVKPHLPIECLEKLEKFLEERHLSMKEIIGMVH